MSKDDDVVGLTTRTGLWNAVEANPDDYEANRDMGLYCARMKNMVLLAEPYLRKALTFDIDDKAERSWLLLKLGGVYKASGEFDKAWEAFSEASKNLLIESAFELGDIQSIKVGPEAASPLYATALKTIELQAQYAREKTDGYDTRTLVPNKVVYTHIGETIHKLDLFVKARELGWVEPFSPLLIVDSAKIANPCLMDYWRDYLPIVDEREYADQMQNVHGGGLFNLDYYQMPDGLAYNRDIAYWIVQQRWHEQKRAPLLTLKPEHRNRGRHALSQLGMPEDAWFACLHVREDGYHSENVAWSHNRHRNGQLQDYLAAIEHVTSKGGWVVRIGDPSMTALPAIPHVIDLTKSEKTDWMDVYCIAGARLFFGTTSGPLMVASAFGVPVALSNAFPLWSWLHGGHVVMAHKLLRRRSDGATVSIAEALQTPEYTQIFPKIFERAGFDVVDNSPDEILATVEELMDRLDGTATYTRIEEQRQAAYASAIDPFGFGFTVRMASRFLRKHPELIGNEFRSIAS